MYRRQKSESHGEPRERGSFICSAMKKYEGSMLAGYPLASWRKGMLCLRRRFAKLFISKI